MKKRSIKEIIIRVVILLVGLCIAHLGVTLFILADLGSDPYNVLIQGIFRSLQKIIKVHPLSNMLSHGNVHIVISFLIIIILLIVDKKYIKIGTVLCMVCGGPIIDFFSLILKPLFDAMPELWFKLPMLALGCVILAFGMTIVIKSDAGTGPNDLVAVVISDKTKWKFSICRVAVDFTFVLIGFLLHGSFGIGTIICAFLVGLVAGFFLPKSQRIIERILLKLQKNYK